MKYRIIIIIISLLLINTSFAFAYNVIENVPQSAQYSGSLNRNASIDTDSVYYNPAGTALLADGLYFTFNPYIRINSADITVSTDPYGLDYIKMTGSKSFDQSQGGFIKENIISRNRIAAANIIYKKKDIAFFGSYNQINGGKYNFDKGSPYFLYLAAKISAEDSGVTTTNIFSMPLSSLPSVTMTDGMEKVLTHSLTAGFAYNFTSQLSTSLSARYLIMTQESKIRTVSHSIKDITSSFHINGFGQSFGLIGSIDYKISDKINSALHIKWNRKLILNSTLSTDCDLKEIADQKYSSSICIPPSAGFGLNWQPLGWMELDFSADILLNNFTGTDSTDLYNIKLIPDLKISPGFDIGTAITFKIPKDTIISVGYLFTYTGFSKNTYTGNFEELNSNQFAYGSSMKVNKYFSINGSITLISLIDPDKHDSIFYSSADSFIDGVIFNYSCTLKL